MAYAELVTVTNSSSCALGLRVLYYSPKSVYGIAETLVAERGHHVISCSTFAEALRLIFKDSFDAVVVKSEDEEVDVIDFTIKVNRIDRTLPVFLTSDWGPDLASALDDVAAGAFAVTH